jgi:hypothetical protein
LPLKDDKKFISVIKTNFTISNSPQHHKSNLSFVAPSRNQHAKPDHESSDIRLNPFAKPNKRKKRRKSVPNPTRKLIARGRNRDTKSCLVKIGKGRNFSILIIKMRDKKKN